jgi:F0F1-type ATP synthase membrane subunit c/vacuolar-type H+-ATPase subunit K
MGASNIFSRRRGPRTVLVALTWFGIAVATGTAAGASSRQPMLATTSNSDGIVLLALGGGVLLLGLFGFFLFTWSRKRRRPAQCQEERDALAQAEQAVQYWEAARAHLEAVQRGRPTSISANDEASHASLVAKAVDGLRAAIKQRGQCQMDLIHCMASGVPSVAGATVPTEPQPFFIPGSDQSSRSSSNRTD